MSDVATFSDTPTFVPGTLPDLSLSPCFVHSKPVSLRFGGEISSLKIRYELVGPENGPVVVVQGGISANAKVSHAPDKAYKGWWAEIVGPEAAINTQAFRVLSFAYLGGCSGTTGPADVGESEFPSISTQDQAQVLALLLDHLDIDEVHAFVGASYGGMVGLAFAQNYPHRLKKLIAISAPAKPAPLAKAWRITQRRIVKFGLTLGQGSQALGIARGLAMTTYRTADDFSDRFESAPVPGASGFTFPLESYLDHCGAKFIHQFDPKSFLCLCESIDLHQVQPEKITTPTVLIGVPTDQLVPLEDLQTLCGDLNGPAVLHELPSRFGHDAFLKEPERLGPILKQSIDFTTEVSA